MEVGGDVLDAGEVVGAEREPARPRQVIDELFGERPELAIRQRRRQRVLRHAGDRRLLQEQQNDRGTRADVHTIAGRHRHGERLVAATNRDPNCLVRVTVGSSVSLI